MAIASAAPGTVSSWVGVLAGLQEALQQWWGGGQAAEGAGLSDEGLSETVGGWPLGMRRGWPRVTPGSLPRAPE